MLFGKETLVEITDTMGSKMVTEINYVAGKPNLPIRVTYDRRVRVKNQMQEQEEYARFSEEIASDSKKLDPAFKIERTSLGQEKGFYYIVASYTTLQYKEV